MIRSSDDLPGAVGAEHADLGARVEDRVMSFSTSRSGGWKRLTLRMVKMNCGGHGSVDAIGSPAGQCRDPGRGSARARAARRRGRRGRRGSEQLRARTGRAAKRTSSRRPPPRRPWSTAETADVRRRHAAARRPDGRRSPLTANVRAGSPRPRGADGRPGRRTRSRRSVTASERVAGPVDGVEHPVGQAAAAPTTARPWITRWPSWPGWAPWPTRSVGSARFASSSRSRHVLGRAGVADQRERPSCSGCIG